MVDRYNALVGSGFGGNDCAPRLIAAQNPMVPAAAPGALHPTGC